MAKVEVIEYQPQGVCARLMKVAINENGTIEEAQTIGGCSGNSQGVTALIKGMKIDDVIERLQGISCNGKPTSCPDQLATCLLLYKQEKAQTNV